MNAAADGGVTQVGNKAITQRLDPLGADRLQAKGADRRARAVSGDQAVESQSHRRGKDDDVGTPRQIFGQIAAGHTSKAEIDLPLPHPERKLGIAQTVGQRGQGLFNGRRQLPLQRLIRRSRPQIAHDLTAIQRRCGVFLDVYGTNNDKISVHLNATARCIGGEVTTLVFAKNPTNELSPEENGIAAVLEVFEYEHATVRIEENDSFSHDNSFEIYGGAKPSLRIQYASSRPNNFFATALLVLRDTLSKRWSVEFVEVKPEEEPEYEGFDFYIFEHKMPKNLPADGVVVLANPDSIPSIAGVQLGKKYTTGGQEANLMEIDSDHPLLSGISGENITVTEFVELNADGYDTLLSVPGGGGDVPVVIAKNELDQKIAVLGFSLNYSNFSMLLDFPLFMYNLFQYYSPSTLTGHIFEVNDEISLNSRSDVLKVTDQNSNEIELDTFPATITLKKPGHYTVSQIPISGEEVTESFFVKMPESECNISEEVDSLTNPYFAVKEEKADFDLLLYFALTLVALLFVEWWLQSREQF